MSFLSNLHYNGEYCISKLMEEKMNPVTSILKKGLLASVLVAGMILPASANDLSHFQKRFSILRDQDGKLIAVRDRSIALNFKVRPYLEMVKSQMLEEQALLSDKGNYEAEILNLLREDMDESFTNSAERERQEKNRSRFIKRSRKIRR